MTFTFPLLLGGLLLIGVPVLLHLLLRQKPKILPFPAFRFLVQRHRTNLTKLRLRHIVLMALRMLLLAAIVLALAQPKLNYNPAGLPSDQPVTAVFLFDTSASLDYLVGTTQTRLKEAQKRAVQMLTLLPAGSEVVILDSADPTPLGKGEWLTRDLAAQRISQLKLQPGSVAINGRLGAALELLARVATSKDDKVRGERARVLCIFSDRTLASWDTGDRANLQTLANRIPPNFARLAVVQAGIGEQKKLLAELPQALPEVAEKSRQQPLIDPLRLLGERLEQVRADEYPDDATQALLAPVRARQDELLALLEQTAGNTSEEAKKYHSRLTAALTNSLRQSTGFSAFYFDVGAEKPADLSVADLQLVRELAETSGSRLLHRLRVEVAATGDDVQCTLVGDIKGKTKEVPLSIKAGDREFAQFDLDTAEPSLGHHQVKVTAKPNDQLAINNTRYLTFAVKPVLLIADVDDDYARQWAQAVEANRFNSALYRCEIKSPAQLPPLLDAYAAVFLCRLRSPEPGLWKLLGDYVGNGGGVGIIPGDQQMDIKAYNDAKQAQEVMPATFQDIVNARTSPAQWDWTPEAYKQAFLHPFKEWNLGKWDFVVKPRSAQQYWQVEPRKDQGQMLIRYAGGKKPALVERVIDLKRGRAGHVLLFTTPPGLDAWNDYNSDGNSFHVTLVGRAVGYLSGDADRPTLNFLCGQGVPRVPVPVGGQAIAYKLYRDGPAAPAAFVGTVTVEEGHNDAAVPQAQEPGNFTLRRPGDDTAVAWFSVNLPPEESNLARVPRRDIETVLGPETLLALEPTLSLPDGHVSQPWELMPVLMLVLLFALAVENLLANKFYRREAVDEL